MRHYRSLYDATFEPGAFTVLVGPNNSGKSNVVDALHFVSEIYRFGLKTAVSRKGGLENIVFRRARRARGALSFTIEVSLEGEELRYVRRLPRERRSRESNVDQAAEEVRIRHEFALIARNSELLSEAVVQRETITGRLLSPSRDVELFRIERDAQGEVTAKSDDNEDDDGWRQASFLPRGGDVRGLFGRPIDDRELLFNRVRFFGPPLELVVDDFRSLRIYRLNPDECRRSGSPAPSEELGVGGGDLPVVVSYLKERAPKAWRAVMEAMTQVVPGLSEINVEVGYDRLLSLRFVEQGVGRPWTAAEISDGTIRSLALFAAIFDPRTSLLVLEEPENSVHPWIIRVFVDACRNATSGAHGKQIVVTTHSPVVIDALSPDEVAVVWRKNGKTSVAPLVRLNRRAMMLWQDGDVGIFDLLDSGWLRQAVPGGIT